MTEFCERLSLRSAIYTKQNVRDTITYIEDNPIGEHTLYLTAALGWIGAVLDNNYGGITPPDVRMLAAAQRAAYNAWQRVRINKDVRLSERCVAATRLYYAMSAAGDYLKYLR